MKTFKHFMQLIYWVMVYAPITVICIAIYIVYLRVSGDVAICKLYYPEMKTMECYFSSKTVRVPNGR
jgi:hypothetical protein